MERNATLSSVNQGQSDIEIRDARELTAAEMDAVSGGGFFIGLGIALGAGGYYLYKKYSD
jgi:hypothetical protein